MTTQDAIFFDGEGNNWFRRNQVALVQEGRFDWPLHMIAQLDSKERIRTVAELGSSNGWRLASLQKKMPDVRFFGVEASEAAVEDGKNRFPEIEFHRGVLSDIPLKAPCDLVIVYFVLHWVDRASLARSVSEIDRLVKDGGILVLGDFLPGAPQRRRYHHTPQQEVFTYKQDYARIFEAMAIYQELARVTYDHDCKNKSVLVETGAYPESSRAFCSVLRKSATQFYSESQ